MAPPPPPPPPWKGHPFPYRVYRFLDRNVARRNAPICDRDFRLASCCLPQLLLSISNDSFELEVLPSDTNLFVLETMILVTRSAFRFIDSIRKRERKDERERRGGGEEKERKRKEVDDIPVPSNSDEQSRNVTNLVRVELRFERMFCILPCGLIYVRETPPSFHTLLPNHLERFIFT